METYTIKIASEPINWEHIPSLSVKEYSWGGDYRPEVTAKIAFVPQKGFWLKTACKEDAPRAVYTVPNSPVCRDSTMEFFAAFDPQKPDVYINFECNSNGCLLCEFGTNKDRTFIDRLGAAMPKPVPYREGAYWGFTIFIPLELLHQLFGEIAYTAGSVIYANVFKCGDDTEIPHYGSWQPITWPYPSFHQPQFFGKMTIEA